MDARTSIVIDRPIEQVFGFLTDVARMPDWATGVRRARLGSPTMGPGARLVLDYQPGYRVTEVVVRVTDHEPPTVFGLATERGPFAFTGRFELEPAEGGTRITSIIGADPDSLSTKVANWLLGPWLNRSMVRRLDRELAALAGAIGSDPGVRS